MKKKEKLKINLQSRVRKTFFFIFTLFSIFIQSFSESKPVSTIGSLPARERAEMSVEITKISSEKMKGKLNLEEKTISLDFTEIEERVTENRMRMSEEDYEIFFIEDLNSLPTYSANDMRINNNNRGNNGVGRYKYKVVESNGKKKIKVEYIETPEALYMVVKDKKTGRIIKIFNISEFEVENYATESGNIAEEVTYTYNKASCEFEDWGDNQILGDKSCTRDIRVVQETVKGNGSGGLPTIAVGDGWSITVPWAQNNAHLSGEVELLNHNFSYFELMFPVSIYLSNPDRMNTGNDFYKRTILGNPEIARVYGTSVAHNNKSMAQINAKLNMKTNINIDKLRALRGIPGNEFNNVLMTSGDNTNQITLIRGSVTTNNIYFSNANGNVDTKALNYPDIIFRKIIMENNINLNFKDGYQADTPIIFNQNGTSGYTLQQLEVIKSGTHANNFFMTGISSKGTIEVRTNPSNENPLISYDVGENGRAEAKEFSIVGNSAKINLGYGENGVVNLSIKEWNEEQGYEQEFYITHKEESGLIRRTNRVTIKIPARGSGNIGGNNDFKFSSEFRNLTIRDYTGENVTLINNRGEVTAEEDSTRTAGEFPVVAIGNNWSKDIKALETQVNAMTSEYSYEGNLDKIPISVYLKNPIRSGGATATYKQYISDKGTSDERAVAYGATHYGGSKEKIKADLMMELPSDILNRIRNIRQKDFILNSNDNNQLIYMIGNVPTGGQYQIPYGGIENTTNTTKRNFPQITVEKEVVTNDIALEFSLGYEKGSEVSFESSRQSSEAKVTIETTGTHPNYFMTGIPFNGTMDISGNGLNTITGITVNSSGETEEQTLFLSNGGKTANLKLKYETNGVVKMSLENWVGQGEFLLTIVHKEESELVRRTYNVTIKTPQAFELITKGDLDFGTIITGFTGETATTVIEVLGLSSNGLSLIPSQEKIELTKENTSSKVEVGDFIITPQGESNGVETYNLTGAIVKSLEATASGEHSGFFHLNVGLSQRTKVNKR